MRSIKEIAFKDNTTSKENLPFSITYYPGFYGAFFAFQAKDGDPLYFCNCSRLAIKNYITHRIIYRASVNSDPARNFILDSMYFPRKIVDLLLKEKIPSDVNVVTKLLFKENLCHECNNKVPFYRYCHEMYGAIFKQTFGWYINKKAFEYGVIPINNIILLDECPDRIKDLIKINPIEFKEFLKKNYDTLYSSKKNIEYYEKYKTQSEAIWTLIENDVRESFGHKKIGKRGRSSERILYQIIKSIFPNYIVLRNYKPKYLKGLEIDIYLPEMSLGIEYQGEQHFEPIEHWGGEKGLEELQNRDELKKSICDKHNIKLYYFYYNDGLNEEIVRKRLKLKDKS